jgi:hypothetical protein
MPMSTQHCTRTQWDDNNFLSNSHLHTPYLPCRGGYDPDHTQDEEESQLSGFQDLNRRVHTTRIYRIVGQCIHA